MKSTLEHRQNVEIQIIGAFALHSYILWCPLILLADSESPDQTADVESTK